MVTKTKFDTVHLKAKSSIITIKLNKPMEVDNTDEGKAIVVKHAWDQLSEYYRDMVSESNTNFSYCVE